MVDKRPRSDRPEKLHTTGFTVFLRFRFLALAWATSQGSMQAFSQLNYNTNIVFRRLQRNQLNTIRVIFIRKDRLCYYAAILIPHKFNFSHFRLVE